MTLIDSYLGMLQGEYILTEKFRPALSIMKIKSIAGLQCSACLSRCESRFKVNKYELILCRRKCDLENARDVLTGLRRERGGCGRADNPESCLKKFDSKIKSQQDKIRKVGDQIEKAKKSAWRFASAVVGGMK